MLEKINEFAQMKENVDQDWGKEAKWADLEGHTLEARRPNMRAQLYEPRPVLFPPSKIRTLFLSLAWPNICSLLLSFPIFSAG